MKSEKLIASLIITAVGLLIGYMGYQNLQPDKLEQGMNMLNEMSKSLGGEAMPMDYRKDKTLPILTLIAGGVLTIIGLRFVLKARD